MSLIQIFLILFGLAALGFIFWNLFYNNSKKPSKKVFPPEWRNILTKKVKFYSNLSLDDKKRFESDIMSFLKYTQVTGIGFTPTDTDKILVASSGVIVLFGFPEWYFSNLDEVILYADTFNHEFETAGDNRNIGGMVGTGTLSRKMILSRPALYQSFENEKSKNHVGIHEFVHLLDMNDGATDGLPDNLLAKQYTIPWLKLIHDETEIIKQQNSDIRDYATTSKAEFFSVVSEYFFKQPELMKQRHPEMFEILEKVFNQDLA